MRRIKNFGITLCLAAAMMAGMGLKVEAQSNFNTYSYDEWDESVAAPASYQPVAAKHGLEMGQAPGFFHGWRRAPVCGRYRK